MDPPRRHGRPDEELFFDQGQNARQEDPPIDPLRVANPSSTTQPAAAVPPYPMTPGPTTASPAVPAASNQQFNPQASNTYQPYHPPTTHSRVRFDSSSPYRPSVSGYAQAPQVHEPDAPSARPQAQSTGQSSQATGPYIPSGSHQATSSPPNRYAAYSPPPTQEASSMASPQPVPTPDFTAVPRLSAQRRTDSSFSDSTTMGRAGSPLPPAGYSELPGSHTPIPTINPAATHADTHGSSEQTMQTAPIAQQSGGASSGPRQPVQGQPWPPAETVAELDPGLTMPHPNETSRPGGSYSQPISSTQQPYASSTPQPQTHELSSGLEQGMHNLNVQSPAANTSTNAPILGVDAKKQDQSSSTGLGAAGLAGVGLAGAGIAGAAMASNSSNRPEEHGSSDDGRRPSIASPQPQHATGPNESLNAVSPGPGARPPQSPPPNLPEGWISHLDPASGQYYYIYLPTRATQWEVPTNPNPSPARPQSTNQPSASNAGSLSTNQSFSASSGSYLKPAGVAAAGAAAGQQGSPGPGGSGAQGSQSPAVPSGGIEKYKVDPCNGEFFGPYLRYTNMDLESGMWYGSILIITESTQPPSVYLHPTVDLSPNPRQLEAHPIWIHRRWTFYRYDIDVVMDSETDTKWTYAIASKQGYTRYEFIVAGRSQRSWKFIAQSGSEFAMNISYNDRFKLGSHTMLWKDVLQKHQEVGGFHAQLGLGNQVYADKIWKDSVLLDQWTATSGKDNRKNAQWTEQHEREITHAYFHYYSDHYDREDIREAVAQIPQIMTLDDHDIFDGYGSYPEYMQSSNMFKNIGRIGTDMYLLFQHHTTREILQNVRNDFDLFTVTGTGWHFVKYLGPAVVVVGPDCRSERTSQQVMAGATWQGVFPKVARLPPCVQHCIWMVPIPVIYPRLDGAEQLANKMASGKKAATGAFNTVTKVTSSVAGIIGAKESVNEGLNSLKKAIGKSGLMSNVLSPFGELDVLDELRDQWTHDSKDLERTYFIRTLQSIAQSKSLRMTFLSGATNCCGAGLVHDPSRPNDFKTMYQIIASSIVNAPPSPYVLKVLSRNNQRPLYLPMNGRRSSPQTQSDTKEDMLEVFATDINGHSRDMRRLMERRNYTVFVSYDTDASHGATDGGQAGYSNNAQPDQGGAVGQKVSLAVDFLVQKDYIPEIKYQKSATVKYGSIIIPNVEQNGR